MNKNIGAVVVLYNPDKNYIKNINTYLYHVSLLVIVDNSEIPDYSVYKLLEHNNHVKFIINKENTGISKAINDGVKLAVKEGIEWVLTMDQDSFFENNMIESYLSELNEISNNKKVAVIGPVLEKKSEEFIPTKIKEVTSLNTTGSLINTSISYKNAGIFCFTIRKYTFEPYPWKATSSKNPFGRKENKNFPLSCSFILYCAKLLFHNINL